MGRHKANKPRRERPEPKGHEHEGFEFPDGYEDPEGRPVDHQLLGALTGAAFDGCTSCQDPLLTLLVEDAVSTARLVELACMAVHDQAGGLPPALTDDDVPGVARPEFRRLAALGVDGGNDRMYAECELMTPMERRAAANTALDLLIGALIGGHVR